MQGFSSLNNLYFTLSETTVRLCRTLSRKTLRKEISRVLDGTYGVRYWKSLGFYTSTGQVTPVHTMKTYRGVEV